MTRGNRLALLVGLLIGLVELPAATEEAFDIRRHLAKQYPMCQPIFCEDLVRVDWGAAADGPLYYLEALRGRVISTCGGVCWAPDAAQGEVCRTLCPPPTWTCSDHLLHDPKGEVPHASPVQIESTVQ